MKFGIVNSLDRTGQRFENSGYVYDCMDKLVSMYSDGFVEVISGGGKGPETLAIDFAEKNNYPVTRIRPQIKTLGMKEAFAKRNRDIAEVCDILVVFWAGDSPIIHRALRDAAMLQKTAVLFPI